MMLVLSLRLKARVPGVRVQSVFHSFLRVTRDFSTCSASLCSSSGSGVDDQSKGPKRGEFQKRRDFKVKKQRRGVQMPPHTAIDSNMNSDWGSIYQAARPFDPYIVPLPVRMGRAVKGEITPSAFGNLELMKVPNFLHLTPPAIKKHCQALKPLCTPWPDELPSMPLKIETRNYVFPGRSVRHPGATKVVITVDLNDISLSTKARQKMINLAGERYDPKKNTLRLVGKRCPTRKQNLDYVMYLLKVLYLESNRVEPWEMAETENNCAG